MAHDPKLGRRDTWWSWLLAGAVAVLHLGIAASRGALGASRNDDWTYLRILSDFESTGRFLPDPYTRTMLVGQIWLSRPVVEVVGVSISALQVLVTVVGAVGLVAAAAVLRRFLAPGWAFFSVGILALGPIYGSISVTYMTDVPAMAAQSIALYLGVRAIEARNRWVVPLTLSLVTAFVGFTIREYAVVAFIAVLAVFLLARERLTTRSRALVVAAGVLWVCAAVSLVIWRAALAGTDGTALVALAPMTVTLKASLQTGATMAALLAPAAVLLWRPTAWQRTWHWLLALGLALLIGIADLASPGSMLLGNYLTRNGSYSVTLPGTPPVSMPSPAWSALVLLAAASLGAVTVRLLTWVATTPSMKTVRAVRSQPPALVLSVVFGVAGVLFVVFVGALSGDAVFDRYLIPYVPFLAGWVCWIARPTGDGASAHDAGRGRLQATGWITLTVWAVIGLHQVDVAATLDGAKWRMGEQLVEAGYAPEDVDAGLEWFGLHQQGDIRLPLTPPAQGLGFWHGLFEEPRACAVSAYAGHPMPNAGQVVAAVDARSVLGIEYALVGREIDVDCSSPR